jgi:hypothetical protein
MVYLIKTRMRLRKVRQAEVQLSSLASRSASAFRRDQQATFLKLKIRLRPVANAGNRMPQLLGSNQVAARYPAVAKWFQASRSRFVTGAGEI